MSSQVLFYVLFGCLIAFVLYRYFRNRLVPRVSVAEADARVRSGEAVFLDVRTEKEQRAEHIKGALHIPLHELRRRSDELTRQGSREIICYCQNGNRSVSAAALLRKRGMKASSMEGGLGEWNYHRLRKG